MGGVNSCRSWTTKGLGENNDKHKILGYNNTRGHCEKMEARHNTTTVQKHLPWTGVLLAFIYQQGILSVSCIIYSMYYYAHMAACTHGKECKTVNIQLVFIITWKKCFVVPQGVLTPSKTSEMINSKDSKAFEVWL